MFLIKCAATENRYRELLGIWITRYPKKTRLLI